MTIKDLKNKLNTMDESCTVTLQQPDGTEMDITDARQQGDHLTFWIDTTSSRI
jgi:hypothetical protein